MRLSREEDITYTITLKREEAHALARALEVYRTHRFLNHESLENTIACKILDYITPPVGGGRRR